MLDFHNGVVFLTDGRFPLKDTHRIARVIREYTQNPCVVTFVTNHNHLYIDGEMVSLTGGRAVHSPNVARVIREIRDYFTFRKQFEGLRIGSLVRVAGHIEDLHNEIDGEPVEIEPDEIGVVVRLGRSPRLAYVLFPSLKQFIGVPASSLKIAQL